LVAILFVLTLVIASGSLSLRKVRIVIVTGGGSKVYDGLPLECEDYKITGGKLKDNHTIEITTIGSQTLPGTSENDASVVIYDESGIDVTRDYDVTIKPGELTVFRRPLGLKSEDASKVYNGTVLKCEKAVVVDGWLADNHHIRYSGFASLTKPGETQNLFQARILDEKGRDITTEYDVTYEYGTLTILYSQLVIASESASKVYDGTPLVADRYTIQAGSLWKGHTLQVTATGEAVLVGSFANRMKVSVKDENGEDITDMYKINTEPGWLKIIPRNLEVLIHDVTLSYEEPSIENDWEIIGGTLVEGDELMIRTAQQMTPGVSPGTYENTLVYYHVLRRMSGEDATACYSIRAIPGQLRVLAPE